MLIINKTSKPQVYTLNNGIGLGFEKNILHVTLMVFRYLMNKSVILETHYRY